MDELKRAPAQLRPPPPESTIVLESRRTRAATQGRSWQSNEVPSSVPDQDVVKPDPAGRALRNNLLPPTTRAGRGSRFTSRAQPITSLRSTPATTSRSQRRRPTYKEDSDSDDELLMSKPEKEDDDRTEPADDDYMEADPEELGPSSRKRKRGATTSRVKTMAASQTKTTAITPSTRQTKRSKTTASTSASRGLEWEPTRVFALWRQDGHFYPGVVHSHQNGLHYLIKFDDGTEATVNIDQMRACEIRLADAVIIGNNTRSSRVTSIENLGSDFVGVSVDGDTEEISISDIRIAHKTISYAWKDRLLSPDAIIPVIKPVKVKLSPSPSKFSIISGPRGSRRKIFANTGLVVTLSAGNENWERDKEAVMTAIKNSGGIVIDDWASIIRMEGKYSHQNNRWVVEKVDVEWNGNDDIERVFLLADDANQKPKFLIALALGIPCLSTTWLHDSVNLVSILPFVCLFFWLSEFWKSEEKDWLGYMLPQGYSEALNARPSQQVDVDWGNSIHQLKDIMCNSVASKLFAEQSILCIGPEMVPLQRGKKVSHCTDCTSLTALTNPSLIIPPCSG